MRKVKLYIAASLDGYIATTDHAVTWLDQFEKIENEDYGYQQFLDSIDTIIMGGNTFRAIKAFGITWPYPDKKVIVISRKEQEHPGEDLDIEFHSSNLEKLFEDLIKSDGLDIWLMGGGEIIAMMLEYEKVHEIQLCTLPLLLGNGIPLFPHNSTKSRWHLHSLTSYENSITRANYSIEPKRD